MDYYVSGITMDKMTMGCHTACLLPWCIIPSSARIYMMSEAEIELLSSVRVCAMSV